MYATHLLIDYRYFASTMVAACTTNTALQEQLSQWTVQLEAINKLPSQTPERNAAIRAFVTGFVPLDVGEDDITGFGDSIFNDDEFFDSILREIKQCECGDNVESIKDNQRTRAVFTLKPLAGQLEAGGSSLDIVREVVFIFEGGHWRAEG
jgi:hypothetical protein